MIYPNTTFRDGIENTFAVSSTSVKGHYPLYVSWEDFSAGVNNVILSGSFDGGQTWSAPIQVNDNAAPVDEFQPNLTVSANGVVSNAFYDRRLACPGAGTSEATAAGIAPHPGNATGEETFIGDYFGNITSSLGNFFSFTSTFNDGTNPGNRQQQVIGRAAIPSAR